MQNQTIFELYTDDIKSKYLAILGTFLNLKQIMKNSTSSELAATATEFVRKKA